MNEVVTHDMTTNQGFPDEANKDDKEKQDGQVQHGSLKIMICFDAWGSNMRQYEYSSHG